MRSYFNLLWSLRVETKGLTVIEAVIGFAVVLNPRTSAYIATIPSPCVLYQRLSKEEVAIADQPLRLLEHMPVFPHFRKTITRKYSVCTEMN